MEIKVEPNLDPVYRTVIWFSDTTVSKKEQLARKISAIALAVLLTFTIIGIYFVLKGIRIWKQLSTEKERTVPTAVREVLPVRFQQNTDPFPEPYHKLRAMDLYDEQELETIRRKLQRARTRGNRTIYPRCYPQLIEAVSSVEKARKLFDEGLILIHYMCIREYEGRRVNPIDYQRFVLPYMDMLFSYLLENQRFPDDIYEGWTLD